MTQKTTTVEQELARLNALRPPSDYLPRQRALFDAQVSRLAAMLEPAVRMALEGEASSEIAQEWLDEARRALALIGPEQERDSDLPPELEEAAALVRKSLVERLDHGLLKPPPEEIRSHTRELAQGVLANWLTILEHVKQDSGGRTLALDANAIPEGVGHDRLYAGVEDFVLSVDRVAATFVEYLESLEQAGAVVTLAPDLHLVHANGRRYLTATEEAARALLPAKEKAPEVATPRIVEFVDEVIKPFLDPWPLFGRKPAHAHAGHLLDEQLDHEVALAAAYQATSEEASAGVIRGTNTDMQLNEAERRISADLAQCAMLDLGLAAEPERLHLGLRMQRHWVKWRLTGEVPSPLQPDALTPLYRISVSATSYAICGATGFMPDHSRVYALMESNPEARRVFDVSVQTAKHALKMPQVASIKERMYQRMSKRDRAWSGGALG